MYDTVAADSGLAVGELPETVTATYSCCFIQEACWHLKHSIVSFTLYFTCEDYLYVIVCLLCEELN